MKILDTINLYLSAHPHMLAHLEHAFLVKFWLLVGLAVYFFLFPYRENSRKMKQQEKLSAKDGHFLA